MKGELYINGLDAWENWGITMDSSSLSTLMTPAGLKDYPTNKSRLDHGVQYLIDDNVRMDERDLTLSLALVAPTKALFFARYESFCAQLATGQINIKTKYQSDVVYKCLYKSCSQYQQYLGKVGKFSLKLVEPDPTDRTED